MIEIDDVIPWSAPGRSACAELAGCQIHIPARDLERAVTFYLLVFGLRPVHGRAGCGTVIPATARVDLVVHELPHSGLQSAFFTRRWGFVVKDLDRVRQDVWELGVTVARDSGAPDHIYRWRNGRSLYVRAHDGNEIELVEICDGARAASPGPFGASLKTVPGRVAVDSRFAAAASS